MKYFSRLALLCLAALMFTCQDDEKIRRAEALRAEKQNDSILSIISSKWDFDIPPATPKVQERINAWEEWRQFKEELSQKPTGTISSYKQKTRNLVSKAEGLLTNIPPFFNEPQVKSRIGVVITKIKTLHTYMNLTVVQEKKAIVLIDEIVAETVSLQNQLDEIVRFSEIPKEEGEEEMLRALDTIRMADPDKIPQPEGNPASTSSVKRTRPPFKKPLKPIN